MRLGGDFDEIKLEMDRAIEIFSDRAEPYYYFGLYCNQLGNFEMGYEYLKKARSLSLSNAQSKYILFVMNNCYEKYINDELSVSCYWTGRYNEGLDYLNEIINDSTFEGHKGRLTDNYNFFMEKLNK
jgi:tetratricopeptide (TPR) repeat protein